MAQIMGPPPFFDQHDYPILTNDSNLPWSHHGRFGRLSYMAWVMVMVFANVVIVTLLAIIGTIAGVTFNSSAGISLLLVGAFCLTPSLFLMIIFQIRRLHDLNHSGWWVALPLIHALCMQVLIILTHSVNLGLVLTGFAVMLNIVFTLYLMIAEGSEGINDYGTPRLTSSWEKMTGWIYVVISVIGLIGFTLIAIPTYQNYQKQAAMMHASMPPFYQFSEKTEFLINY